MSTRSYTRCWLHLVWATKRREPILTGDASARVAGYLREYAAGQGIFPDCNNVQSDHVHALIDLPTNRSIEETVKLLKGASSHWINANPIVAGHFEWQDGYAAFSVSESRRKAVRRYITNQEQHHRRKTFDEEIREFVGSYGLVWREDGRGYAQVNPAMNCGATD
ncbi:MAG: IS200/IS605 family transposase [bacterium]|nr:IS200/IS605 family transposase [bacterium]